MLIRSPRFRSDVAPALDLNFAGMAPGGALDSRISFARATTETALNASAVLTSFGNNVPAFAYDTVSHIALGAAWFGQVINKSTNFNANPTDLTGMTLSGDPAATLTVVDDTAAISAAGLSGICTSGKVYKLDNSAGTTNSFAAISGAVGNLNPHSLSAYARTNGAPCAIRFNGANQVTFTNLGYVRQRVENITPANTTQSFAFDAPGGSIVWFVLNQLEENPFATPVIVVAGAAATRNTDVGTVPLNVTSIPTNPVGLTIIGKARTAAGIDAAKWQIAAQLDTGVDGSRLTVRRNGSGILIAEAVIGGVNQAVLTLGGAANNNTDTAFWFAAADSDFAGQELGRSKVTSSSGAMLSGLTNLRIGAAAGGTNLWNSTIARLIIYNRRLPDAQAAAIAASL